MPTASPFRLTLFQSQGHVPNVDPPESLKIYVHRKCPLGCIQATKDLILKVREFQLPTAKYERKERNNMHSRRLI